MSLKKTKILIVDDYKENITALAELIANDDVEIFSATHATAALELVASHEFGLALLDVQMPETDGFELATIIRGVARFRKMPIIFVTAQSQDSAFIFKGYSTGAVDLLFKPFDPNIVRTKVRVFVELAQQKQLLQEKVEELEKLRLEADAANLAKSQFLANMSHEIRTPLSAVIGFTDLIARDDVVGKEKQECVDAVRRNGALLMHLIDDILDLSKIEANKLQLDEKIFSFSELMRDVTGTMSFRASEKGVSLKCDGLSLNIDKFVSDPVRIKQVLLNIVGNAVKFTPSGGKIDVEIAAREVHSPDRSWQKIEVIVTDTGIGLNPEETRRLFQPFMQADASTKRRFGGSGLGLVIARQIARALKGDIKILSSTPGEGTKVMAEFVLPVAPESTAKGSVRKVQGPAANSLAGLKILAVDDSPDNLKLLTFYLKNSGADLCLAENGMQAIENAKSKTFDVILMDIQMPGMDGNEAISTIRQIGFKRRIIAMTAHATRDEHEKSLNAGCDEVLTKPVSRAKLISNLESIARSKL